VVPAVAGFKKQGANNGACLSFLISTPETGADSIALTYSLLDPIMTIMRPVTAFVTALVAGTVENLSSLRHAAVGTAGADASGAGPGPCDADRTVREDKAGSPPSFGERLAAGLRFSFEDLMADLTPWFIVGILMAGLITTFVSDSFVTENLSSGIGAYLLMLAAGLPMYVCATMATPVAAALVMKGMAPGAALIFLITGPATNMATVTVVAGMLGRRTLGIYLGSIVVVALLFAFLTDAIYGGFGISAPAAAGATAGELVPAWLEWGSAVVLGVLMARVLWRRGARDAISRIASIVSTSDRSPAVTCCSEEGTSGCT
jgi:uncharacterized membrane protein YraQ (UPF0718 family)